MRICITSTGKDLDAQVDAVFGRARYFLLVDPETLEVESVENMPGAHGAGVQAAQTMVDKGISIILTGNVGPNAFQGLTAAGIKIHLGAKGTGRDALTAYQGGALQATSGPTSQGHGGRQR